MRGLLAVALVGLLAVTAGCNALVGADRGPTTETVTPAPVPTVSPDYPPGIGRDSVDAAALVAAHRRSLEGTSYTLDTTLQYGPIDGEYYGETTVRTVGAGGEPVAIVGNRSVHNAFATWTRYEVWYDGSETAVRQVNANGAVDRGVFENSSPSDDALASVVQTVFATLDRWQVTRTRDDVAVTGSFSRADVMPGPPRASNASNATMRAQVDASGRVDHLAVAYDATVGNRRVDVRFVMRVHAVGATTVTEPEWADDSPAPDAEAGAPSATGSSQPHTGTTNV